MNLFIIDDDEEDIEYLVDTIADLDSSVTCHWETSGDKAMQKIAQLDPLPSCIFLDGSLAGMSSEKCIKSLKSDNALKHIPVVMYSGFDQQKVQHNFLMLGADEFIVKPTRRDQLISSLTKVLKLASGVQPADTGK